jgi:hypothetical protein
MDTPEPGSPMETRAPRSCASVLIGEDSAVTTCTTSS